MKLTLEIEQVEPGKFSVVSPDLPTQSVYGIGVDPPSAISSFAERLGVYYQDLTYAVAKYPERETPIFLYLQRLWNEITESTIEAVRQRLLKKLDAREPYTEQDDLDEIRLYQQHQIDSVWFLVDAAQDAICYISKKEETDERMTEHLEYNYKHKKGSLPPTDGEQILEKLRDACLAVQGRRGNWPGPYSWWDLIVAAPLMFHAISRIAEWASRMTRCPFCGEMYAGHGHMISGYGPELKLRRGAPCVMSEVWSAFGIVGRSVPPDPEDKNIIYPDVYPEKLTQARIEEIRVMALSRVADGDLETGAPLLHLLEHIERS